MKKAVFFLALMLLGSSYLKAQPYLTVVNSTSCNVTILGRAVIPNVCTNPIVVMQTVAPGTTIFDASVICPSCSTPSYVWATCRVNDGCGNEAAVGDGSSCNSFPLSDNLTIGSCAGSCGSVTVDYVPGSSGDATINIY